MVVSATRAGVGIFHSRSTGEYFRYYTQGQCLVKAVWQRHSEIFCFENYAPQRYGSSIPLPVITLRYQRVRKLAVGFIAEMGYRKVYRAELTTDPQVLFPGKQVNQDR